MSRVTALLARVAAACAVLLVAALLTPADVASASTARSDMRTTGSAAEGSASAPLTAGDLALARALMSNGVMRAVSSLDECTSHDTRVSLTPGPTSVCIQPSGSMPGEECS